MRLLVLPPRRLKDISKAAPELAAVRLGKPAGTCAGERARLHAHTSAVGWGQAQSFWIVEMAFVLVDVDSSSRSALLLLLLGSQQARGVFGYNLPPTCSLAARRLGVPRRTPRDAHRLSRIARRLVSPIPQLRPAFHPRARTRGQLLRCLSVLETLEATRRRATSPPFSWPAG